MTEITDFLSLDLEVANNEESHHNFINDNEQKIISLTQSIIDIKHQLEEINTKCEYLVLETNKFKDDKSIAFLQKLIKLTSESKVVSLIHPTQYIYSYGYDKYPCFLDKNIATNGVYHKIHGYILLCKCCYEKNKELINIYYPIEFVLYKNPNYKN